MSKLISYEFKINTACVELLFADSNIISIDCIVVENEVADNRFDRAELDWLIYNKPLVNFEYRAPLARKTSPTLTEI